MRRDHLARRAASAALAACMMFTLSAPALAESTDALLQLSMASRSAVSVLDAENSVWRTFNIENGSIRVYTDEFDTLWVQQGSDFCKYPVNNSVAIAISGTSSENTLTIEGTAAAANVVLRNLNIDVSDKSDVAAVSVSGEVNLTLEGANVLKSGSYCAGLQKNDDGQLTINGSGSLEAYGKDGGAGIGSCRGNAVSNITIKDGTITAIGSDNAAGIGSGQGRNASNLIIEGGVVTARGGDNAAGIGGGYFGRASDITIRDGTVKACAGQSAAAIGSGYGNSAEKISITGGEITVQRNNRSWIGGYYSGEIQIDPIELHQKGGSITYLNEDGTENHKTFVTDITVNGATVTSYNYTDILKDGKLSYDPDTKTLKSSGKIYNNNLTIDAPDTAVVLEGKGADVVSGELNITNSASVEITGGVAGKAAAITSNASITSEGDVTITSLWDRAMGGEKLTVNAGGDVTITGGCAAAAIWKDAEITSTGGSVTINNSDPDGWAQGTKENGGTLIVNAENGSVNIIGSSGGGELLMQNATITSGIPLTLENRSNAALAEELHVEINSEGPWVYYTSNSSDAEVGDPRIALIPDEAGKGSYLHAKASELHEITVTNGTFQVGTDDTGLTTAFPGEKVTVTGNDENASFSKFVKWEVVKPDGFTLSEEQQNTEKMTFTMPEGAVELKAIYSIPSITMDVPVIVTDGTINDGTENPLLVKPGTAITVKANKKDEPVQFHHWKVEQGTSEDFALTEGSSLGSETEAGTEEIHFIMPKGGVRLTAVYSVPAGVQKNYVTVDGGIGTATINGSNNAKAEVEIGSDVTVSAEVDQLQYPGMVFDYWEIVYPESFSQFTDEQLAKLGLVLALDDAESSTATFTMPKYPVTLVAHWKDGVEPGFDDPTDPDFGKDGSGAAGAIVAGAALGGAAIWGGYEITTRAILNDLLPEGAAIPANRGQLAALIWAKKGKPEPAAQPAFTDVADAGLAKAAQWCVEQGLLDAKDGKFDPDGWMPKYKTIEVWKKAFPKQ